MLDALIGWSVKSRIEKLGPLCGGDFVLADFVFVVDGTAIVKPAATGPRGVADGSDGGELDAGGVGPALRPASRLGVGRCWRECHTSNAQGGHEGACDPA